MSGMRIGEVAQASGTTTKTLRYYEEFGLLPAADRTPAGYRDYGPEVLDRLRTEFGYVPRYTSAQAFAAWQQGRETPPATGG